MNNELIRTVQAIHLDKGIPNDVIFDAIESAYLVACQRYFGGEDAPVQVRLDRDTGEIHATHEGQKVDRDTLGRISAQHAKQIIIQKIREAERDTTFNRYAGYRGTILTGVAQRADGGVVTVTLDGKHEAILPRSEQMPGEQYPPQARVRALLLDVRRNGLRVKLVLSRASPEFVKQLFEQEIPEIAERVIEIRSIAREAGYRTKIAVSSIDSKVDSVGACVGVRGSRIKNVLEELEGERIDVIRYNDSPHLFIPAALQPATVDELRLYPRMGRAIALVKDDQLSLAIGKRGQNVRLASKLVGVDIVIMTPEELEAVIEKATKQLLEVPQLIGDEDMVSALIEEGILSFDDLSVTEPDTLVEMLGIEEDQAEEILAFCEVKAEEQPQETSTRNAMLAGTTPRPTAQQVASQLLGDLEPAAPAPADRTPTVAELFGEEPEKSKPESRVSVHDLFKNLDEQAGGSAKPAAESS